MIIIAILDILYHAFLFSYISFFILSFFPPSLLPAPGNPKKPTITYISIPFISMATQQWGEETRGGVFSSNPPPRWKAEQKGTEWEKRSGKAGVEQKESKREKRKKERQSRRGWERERERKVEGGRGSPAITCSCAKWSIYGNLDWLSENWSPFCLSPFCSASAYSKTPFISPFRTQFHIPLFILLLVWCEPPTGAKTLFGRHTDRKNDRQTNSWRLLFQGNETSRPQPIFAMDVVCNENPAWVQEEGGETEEPACFISHRGRCK